MAEAFYRPGSAGVFRSTEHTVGPWSATDQHAGPPSALLVRALEAEVAGTDPGWLARVSVDLLGAVPVAELTVRSRLVRPGRRVRLAEAELAVDGTVVARAGGWWYRAGDTASVAPPPAPAPPLPEPAAAPDPRDHWPGGYLRAMEWRWVRGHFAEPGPAAVWARMRLPLVDGEEPTPTQRVFAAADSGSGVSSTLPLSEWLYVNTELTVHLHRPPVGEWVCLDATTVIGSTGGGLATSTVSDRDGAVGRGAQALVVRPR